MSRVTSFLAFAAYLVSSSSAQAPSCSSTLTPKAAPSVAPGYAAVLVANGLTSPRGIKFDSAGNLLVVEKNKGVTALNIADNGGNCPQSTNKKTVISDESLNHGIEMQTNNDGTYLYASSTDAVYRWAYASNSQSNTSAPLIVVNNMTGTDHNTRTLLFSKKSPDTLIVTRGSLENLDPLSAYKPNMLSVVKSFNLANGGFPVEYTHNGELLGWGMRNEVGIDEHPSGYIYSVENSADEITRGGVDIHQDNPGEKLNSLGLINSQGYTTAPGGSQEPNYGYPYCFAAWDPSVIPNFNGTVGQQFAIDGPNDVTLNDTYCQSLVAPRLTFQAHMAPLDILFDPAGTHAWVTFHGSWDRTAPVGYKLSVIEFNTGGSPVDKSDSKTAAVDIVTNPDNSKCPNQCFRPVGLAWDSRGRLFMSSDATGEIFAIVRTDGNSTAYPGSIASSGPSSPTASSSSSPASSSPAASSGSTTGAASSTLSTSIGVISSSSPAPFSASTLATVPSSTSTSASSSAAVSSTVQSSTVSSSTVPSSTASSSTIPSSTASSSVAPSSMAPSSTAPSSTAPILPVTSSQAVSSPTVSSQAASPPTVSSPTVATPTISYATVTYQSQPPCHEQPGGYPPGGYRQHPQYPEHPQHPPWGPYWWPPREN